MSIENCILTTKDFTILEVMRDRCLDQCDPLATVLDRKIGSATVVFRNDVPANVATANSRVSFSVDGRDPDTRILTHERAAAPVGMCLPMTTARGLALLGLSEGQEFRLTNAEGNEERIVLEKVHYQPEAARREKEAMAPVAGRCRQRPTLTLVGGSAYGGPSPASLAQNGSDDPGPSAA